MSETIYDAACVLVRHSDGRRVLAVSRGKDLTNLGFPGGSKELGESSEENAKREVFEETGLVLHEEYLVEVYSDTVQSSSKSGKTFNVVTFEYKPEENKANKGLLRVGYGEFLLSSHEGTAMWVTPEQMVAHSCVFAKYNRAVLELAGLL